MDDVIIRRDLLYKETLTIDLYYPPDTGEDARSLAPAVLFVTGFPAAGVRRILGCEAKEMESYISWGRLVAASGMVGITYAAQQPESDVRDVLQHLRQNANSLGIDARRIGIWSCSGNVPNALALLMREGEDRGGGGPQERQERHERLEGLDLKCAVLCYGYMLDLDGATHVADAATMFGFVNPAAGRSVSDLPRDVPLLVVRAGRDEMPQLNDAIDGFLSHALRANLPVTLINHHVAPHAFDILDDTDASRAVIERIVAFMQSHLLR